MSGESAKKILVVDDEVAILKFVSRVLKKKGFEVSLAKDGREGLKLADSIKPDLIITDIAMPDMDGIEFILTLGSKNKKAPIIAMSGNKIGQNFFKAARIFGAQGSMMKPFTARDLTRAVLRVFVTIQHKN